MFIFLTRKKATERYTGSERGPREESPFRSSIYFWDENDKIRDGFKVKAFFWSSLNFAQLSKVPRVSENLCKEATDLKTLKS